MEKTEAEQHFDRLIAERRATGRETYGRGLTHTDAYNWNMMALEEALDMCQYLAAQNLRLHLALKMLGQHAPNCRIHKSDPEFCTCGLREALS